MILEIDEITKTFGGLRAIDGLSFSVDRGEVFGVIGPNGAGKTTMFNIITSNYEATSGKVLFDGKNITNLKPHRVTAHGIARTFQNIRLFGSMSVLENILIGFHNSTRYTFVEALFRVGRYFGEERRIRERAFEILDYLGIAQYANEKATSLSYGNQRKVEIARALAIEPKLLLLDEPAAGMNPRETEGLAEIIKRVRDDFSLSVVLIEHDMPFVNALCDRVLVLDYGKKLFIGTPQEAISHKDVIAAYLGDIENVDL